VRVPESVAEPQSNPAPGPAPAGRAGVAAAGADVVLGTAGVVKRDVAADETVRANRRWWDVDADHYQAEHGRFLGEVDFVWCPERLREEEARLLGEVSGRRVLEVGCGAAMCARWLRTQGADAVALDLSSGMLRHAAEAAARTGVSVPLVQADAQRLPFADASFDLACSAFGAVPFVADSAAVMREVARVLRPGGRWVFATTHPIRWIFADDPGPEGLVARNPYFDRTPYVEVDGDRVPTYVEHHRTLGDRVREIAAAGLVLSDLVEPEWPPGLTEEWGQWSPLRGQILPGTAIYVCERP
jgi:SAM-dependent methyltransferase